MSEVKRFNYIYNHVIECCEMVQANDGGYVRYEDYSALKAERDALAAENAALDKFFRYAWKIAIKDCDFDGYSIQHLASNLGLVKAEIYDHEKHADLVSDASDFSNGDEVFFPVQSFATDAFLLNAQADGVDKLGEYYNFSTPMLVQVEAKHFAKKLRAQAEELQKGGDDHA